MTTPGPALLLSSVLRYREFRGKGTLARLVARFLPRSGWTWLKFSGGYQIAVDLGHASGRKIAVGLFERSETQLVRTLLVKGDLVIDVGANVGYYSLLAASLVGEEGTVVAVEPNRAVAALLKAGVARAGFADRLVVVEAMAGAEYSTAWLASTEAEDSMATSGRRTGAESGASIPVLPLDYIVKSFLTSPNQRVALLKIDVEGWEESVLVGAHSVLAASDFVMLERNVAALEAVGSSWDSIVDELQRFGLHFSQWLSKDPGPEANYANAIFCRRPGQWRR